MVEAALLRRNVAVFRDERDIRQGERIDERIGEEISRCTMFIGLWCHEYVASPYCHDEVRMWCANHPGAEGLYLLRFDDTRPVWSTVRASENDRDTFGRRFEMVHEEGLVTRKLVELALRQLLDPDPDD